MYIYIYLFIYIHIHSPVTVLSDAPPRSFSSFQSLQPASPFISYAALQGVTAASSGTHTHAGGKSSRPAWRCLARPVCGMRRLPEGSRRYTGGVSVTCSPLLCFVLNQGVGPQLGLCKIFV